ncbi:uncharacterized protein LOC134683036 [Mytilus trossulus]|uniref:uncharacterized protein LOC134683036 n=1 Tax=Mytilus trossulus TaxID=6551 RepID=UPI0030071CC8
MSYYRNFLYFAASLFAWIAHSEGRIVSTYLSSHTFSWLEGKEYCQMASLEEAQNISSSYKGLSWVDVTGTYSTWVEYLGCFDVKHLKIATEKIFINGTSLSDCLETCQGSFFIGLQVKRCACLLNITLNSLSVNSECRYDLLVTCLKDGRAFCASEDTVISTQHFAVYKKVNIATQTVGECLSVTNRGSFLSYIALDCLTELFAICLNDIYKNYFYAQKKRKKTWIESFMECESTILARRSQILDDSPLDTNVSYWLANTRRFVKHVTARRNPEFCMAVQVQKNGKIIQYPRPCKTRLPALCLGTEAVNNELLVTLLVIVSVLTVVVTAVIIVLYMRLRKRGSNTGHLPMDSSKEVIYATVNKPRKSPTNQEQSRKRTPGQPDIDETYDHTNHHRLSQNQSTNESYYDTMQGKGIEDESNYDLTHEPDRDKPVVVDDSVEYSHMEDDI